jgi:HEPN domain-containing protein
MSPNHELRSEANKWLREANKDLHSAKLLLHPGEPEPSRSLFHCQQAAEKATKAFLAFSNVPFRKTHDLVALGLQCGDVDPSLTALLSEAADLTDYASTFRYPDAPYEPDLDEALRALEIAERLFAQISTRIGAPGG